MKTSKLKQKRQHKRHEKQEWTKEAKQIFEEIRNSKYCGTDKMRQIKEAQEEGLIPRF